MWFLEYVILESSSRLLIQKKNRGKEKEGNMEGKRRKEEGGKGEKKENERDRERRERRKEGNLKGI